MANNSGLRPSGLPSNLEHAFNRVPAIEKPRSTFERSSSHKMTHDPNVLFPIYHDQVYPGDTHQVSGTLFSRILSPLKFPIMDNMYLDWFAFFVPERIVWDNFERSMGQTVTPGESTDFLIPQVVADDGQKWTLHSLGDYFGVIGAVFPQNMIPVNAIKFRDYNKIIFDWFCDQNLVNGPILNTDDGPDSPDDYPLFTRRKRHDYFTSMLPFAQKGTAPTLPITGNAPVVTDGTGAPIQLATATLSGHLTNETAAANLPSLALGIVGGASGAEDVSFKLNVATGLQILGSAFAGITINQLRLYVTTQQFLEMNARAGTRYIEQNLAHFGVVSPDARLQRSEFLGAGTVPINVHPIASTSGGSGGAPLGSLGSFATMNGKVQFSHSFVEHGYILVLAEVRADLTYWQGIAHDYFESAQLDRYYPVFANIGEQGILSQEIYATGAGGDTGIFGYQEAWAHLRYKPSTIGGFFRPDAPGTLDAWHLSQDFGARPTLTNIFISEAMPISRVVSSSSEPFFILDSWFSNKTTRVLPVFSVPGLMRL